MSHIKYTLTPIFFFLLLFAEPTMSSLQTLINSNNVLYAQQTPIKTIVLLIDGSGSIDNNDFQIYQR